MCINQWSIHEQLLVELKVVCTTTKYYAWICNRTRGVDSGMHITYLLSWRMRIVVFKSWMVWSMEGPTSLLPNMWWNPRGGGSATGTPSCKLMSHGNMQSPKRDNKKDKKGIKEKKKILLNAF